MGGTKGCPSHCSDDDIEWGTLYISGHRIGRPKIGEREGEMELSQAVAIVHKKER